MAREPVGGRAKDSVGGAPGYYSGAGRRTSSGTDIGVPSQSHALGYGVPERRLYTVDNHGLGIDGGDHSSSVYAYAFFLAANSVPEPVIVLFLGLVSLRVAWSCCRAAPCASQRTPSALSLRPKLALRRIEQCLRAGALRTLLRSSEDRRSLGKIAHAVMGTTCARKRILLSRQVRSFLEDFLRKKTELR